MTELLRTEVGFPRRGPKTQVWSFPRVGSKTQVGSLPPEEARTQGEIRSPAKILPRRWVIPLVLIWGWNASFGGWAYAARLRPSRISRQHGDLDGRPDGRRDERMKHDETVADARCCWRARFLRQRPTGQRRPRAAKRSDRGGTALGIALGFSFQVRHRPINPSVARPAHVELRSFATPPHDGCAFIGTIPT